MEYTIKQVAKKLEISEQGIYKRIKTNNDNYLAKGFITTKLVEQPNGTTKNQTFITDSGLEFLLEAQRLRTSDIKPNSTEVEQPLNQGLNNHSTKVEQPIQPQEAQNDTQSLAFEQIKLVLNQQIEDLKADNKRLVEKLETQEQKFELKFEQEKQEHKEQLEQKKQEYKEQLEAQQKYFQFAIEQVKLQYEDAIKLLPQPQEDVIQPTATATEVIQQEDAPTEKRGFFSRLFGRK